MKIVVQGLKCDEDDISDAWKVIVMMRWWCYLVVMVGVMVMMVVFYGDVENDGDYGDYNVRVIITAMVWWYKRWQLCWRYDEDDNNGKDYETEEAQATATEHLS